MYDERFMRRAIELSAQALNTPGTRPLAAVAVKDGKVVGEGLNQSAINYDPTAHGEVEAIRDACRNLKTTDLSGADLYTSSEPCAVCVGAMLISGIGRMYYGASLEQSGRAARVLNCCRTPTRYVARSACRWRSEKCRRSKSSTANRSPCWKHGRPR